MDISQLLAGPANEMPRRSSSNAHSVTAPSPSTSAAKLPSPPAPVVPNPQTMRPKRKRNDPKPIWAVLEHERAENEHQESQQRTESRPPPARQPPLAPVPMAARSQPPPPAARPNGVHSAPSMPAPPVLSGFERPITNDATIYNEITRKVCDFIWNIVIVNPQLREAVNSSPGCEVEIEARWGQIIDTGTGFRLQGAHDTECVVRESWKNTTRFESTMSLEQHKKMNFFLNTQVSQSNAKDSGRVPVTYKHTKEIDTLYELDQEGFNLMPLPIQTIFRGDSKKQRIRVTRDSTTGQLVRKLIKCRLGNLEISSPQTEWDYRIGINLEIQYPGPIEDLSPIVENGSSADQRKKDRVSYSYLQTYQIDLTQVTQGPRKNHELELELNGARILEEGDKILRGDEQNSMYEPMVEGMMNNLRVLSREMTPIK